MQKWYRQGSKLVLTPERIPDPFGAGVYRVAASEELGFHLVHLCDKLELPTKVYAMDEAFIAHVMRTIEATPGENLGILLSGTKGTGKTVTAKQICNLTGLPIILVEANLGLGMTLFLASIPQPVVIFMDEYDKTFESERQKDSNAMLPLMDGALNNKDTRKIFLLTTNASSVNENMLNRPARLLFHVRYSDLPYATIIEMVDDMLVHKELRQAVLAYISTLEMITVDIVTKTVSQANIHRQDPAKFAHFLNMSKRGTRWDAIMIVDENTERTIVEDVYMCAFDIDDIEKPVRLRGGVASVGTLKRVRNAHEADVEITSSDYGEENVGKQVHIKIQKVQNIHGAFKGVKPAPPTAPPLSETELLSQAMAGATAGGGGQFMISASRRA